MFEKLSAPSYEAMNAGVTFGIGGIALPADDEVRSVTTRYERAVIDGDVVTGLTPATLAVSLEVATFGHVVTGGRRIEAETVPPHHGRDLGDRGPADRARDGDRDLPRDAARPARGAAREHESGAAVRDAAELRPAARTVRRSHRHRPDARWPPMSDELTFLPWLRRGLVQALTAPGPLDGAIPRGPAVTASVDVQGSQASQDVRLHGPDHVLGLAPGQVLRSEPRADSVEVETTLFPYVELAAPDLPWLYTPAAPGDQGLRPWLVLVVVREQEGVRLDTPAGSTPLLRIDLPPAAIAKELPDLVDAYAWAHVQSVVGLAGAAAAVERGSGEVIARLVCPRRLLPNSSWLACVVPAFDEGAGRPRGDGATRDALPGSLEPPRGALAGRPRLPLVALQHRPGRPLRDAAAAACRRMTAASPSACRRWTSATPG